MDHYDLSLRLFLLYYPPYLASRPSPSKFHPSPLPLPSVLPPGPLSASPLNTNPPVPNIVLPPFSPAFALSQDIGP